VPCTSAPKHPYLPGGRPRPASVGGSNDDVLKSMGMITSARGSFWETDGVTSESGTAEGTGILLSNTYSLQLNSSPFPTNLCKGAVNAGSCSGWHQFIYSNSGSLFMQYWLINFGTNNCPQGWQPFVDGLNRQDCYLSDTATPVQVQPLDDLLFLGLSATIATGGQFEVTLTTFSAAYRHTGSDLLGLAGQWTQAEFNIFGDCCSSQASFSNGTQLGISVHVQDGTDIRPTCIGTSFTAETNNLDLVTPCCPIDHGISFEERNSGGSGLKCTDDTIRVTAVDPNHGPTSGGTRVTVTGNGFHGGNRNGAIMFGSNPGSGIDCPLPNTCTVTTPPSPPGTVDVRYEDSDIVAGDEFTFGGPSITSIHPSTGAEDGGTKIDLLGTNLAPNMLAEFGTIFVGLEGCIDSTHCTAFSPAGKGQVHVTIGSNIRSDPTPADLYTYAPFPSGIMGPDRGPPAGGTQVTISGHNFSVAPGTTTVLFDFGGGHLQSIGLSCASTTQCTMQTPPLTPPGPGPTAVPVTIAVGSKIAPLGEFTYVTPSSPQKPPSWAQFCRECQQDGGTCVAVDGKHICKGTLE
jgi:hypothetical protein